MEERDIGNEALDIKDAIQISRILATAPEERIPLILSVLEKAALVIGGLDELEEWKALKEQAYLVDIHEFVDALQKAFPEEGDAMKIPVKHFGDFCQERKLKPGLVKRLLIKNGFMAPGKNSREKPEYTETVWKEGRAVRCVVIRKVSIKEGKGINRMDETTFQVCIDMHGPNRTRMVLDDGKAAGLQYGSRKPASLPDGGSGQG